MGLLKSIREVLGTASVSPGEAPARRPPVVTYRAELVAAQHEGYESVYLSTERQAELLVPAPMAYLRYTSYATLEHYG